MGRLLLLSFKKSSSSPSVPQGSSCLRGQAQGGSLRERESRFLLLESFCVCVCLFNSFKPFAHFISFINFFFFPCLNVKS